MFFAFNGTKIAQQMFYFYLFQFGRHIRCEKWVKAEQYETARSLPESIFEISGATVTQFSSCRLSNRRTSDPNLLLRDKQIIYSMIYTTVSLLYHCTGKWYWLQIKNKSIFTFWISHRFLSKFWKNEDTSYRSYPPIFVLGIYLGKVERFCLLKILIRISGYTGFVTTFWRKNVQCVQGTYERPPKWLRKWNDRLKRGVHPACIINWFNDSKKIIGRTRTYADWR